MRHLPSSFLAISALVLPLTALAATEVVWSFADSQIDSGWESQGIVESTATDEGLLLKIDKEGGGITRAITFDDPMQAVTIRLKANMPTKGFFVWHDEGRPNGEAPELPFSIEGNGTMETIPIALTHYPQWTGKVDYIGLGFAPDVSVTVEYLKFGHWSGWDNVQELFTGLWTYDEFRPYSINFLWGPLISWNPVMRASLYATLPPMSHSITQWIYGLLGILVVLFVLVSMVGERRSSAAFGLICATFVGLWILFDVRMGSELLTYAMRDVRSYVLAPVGQKTLRTHMGSYDALHQALPILRTQPRFGLITIENAFYALVRYEAYPSLPITPNHDLTGITTWLVIERQDAAIDDQGRIVLGGKILTKPGHILKQYGPSSFLFQIN